MKTLREFLNLGVIIGPLPAIIIDGQIADAAPVMSNFNWIVSQVNTNIASALGTFVYDIRNYGALGTPTDDTAAVQAAINAASAAGGGAVFIPPGSWVFSTVTVPAAVKVFGTGLNSIISPPVGTVNLFKLTGNFASLSNLRVVGTNLTGQTIFLDQSGGAGLAQIFIDHIFQSGLPFGLLTDNNASSNVITNLHVSDCTSLGTRDVGVKLRKSTAFIYLTDITIDYTSQTPNVAGFDISGNAGMFLTRCDVEAGVGTGTRTGQIGFLINASTAVWFQNCDADSLDGAGYSFTGACDAIYLDSCIGGHCQGPQFQFNGNLNVAMSNCYGLGRNSLAGLAAQDIVSLSGGCSHVTITGCNFQQGTGNGINSAATASLVVNGCQFYTNTLRGIVTTGSGSSLFSGCATVGNTAGNWNINGANDHIRNLLINAGSITTTADGPSSG